MQRREEDRHYHIGRGEERMDRTLSHRQRRGEDGHYHIGRGEDRIDTIT